MKLPMKVRARLWQPDGRLHTCQITATRLIHDPNSLDYEFVTKQDVRDGLCAEFGKITTSTTFWNMRRPTENTFKVGCCWFGVAATAVLRKWSGVKVKKVRKS